MTSYSTMAADGRAAARERTTGHRKVTAERIEYGESNGRPYATRVLRLIGSCGHVLRWEASWPVSAADPPYMTRKLGRRVTCIHDDCRIPAKPELPDAERCEYVMGDEVERRCPTRWRHDTEMGKVCRRHRNYYVREGYLDDDGLML